MLLSAAPSDDLMTVLQTNPGSDSSVTVVLWLHIPIFSFKTQNLQGMHVCSAPEWAGSNVVSSGILGGLVGVPGPGKGWE